MSTIKNEFFYPRSVAIFGPSEKRRYYWIRSLISNGFDGAIYPIHPRKKSGAGLRFWKNVFEIDDDIDYAIIAVPARIVPQVLEDCGKKGIPFVSIFSSGFSEIGEEGKKLERQILEIAKKYGIRINGPNCMGIYCPKSGLAFRTDTHQEATGRVSFVSQSGGICINVILRGHKLNIAFSKVISTGNSIDLTPADYIEYLADDPETKVIGAYLENLGKTPEEGRHLFNALKYANRKKPVIVWRGGRTAQGAKAAASHTGAIASNNRIWDGIIKQTGIISVRTFEELMDTLLLFQNTRLKAYPKGPNVGLVSVSGGEGVTNSDLLSDAGLSVPTLSKETIEKMQQDVMIQSVGVSIQNPIDLGNSYFAFSVVEKVLKTIIEDPNIHSMIIEVSNHYVYNLGVLAYKDYPKIFMNLIMNTIKQIKKKIKDKIIVITIPVVAYETERLIDREFFAEKNIPVFDTVENAGKAISNVYKYSRFLKTLELRN